MSTLWTPYARASERVRPTSGKAISVAPSVFHETCAGPRGLVGGTSCDDSAAYSHGVVACAGSAFICTDDHERSARGRGAPFPPHLAQAAGSPKLCLHSSIWILGEGHE